MRTLHPTTDPSAPAAPKAACPAADTVRQRLLLVEDNAIVAISMEVLLRQKGWQVQSIATVAGAIALLDSKPDWVILDLMLPDGEGVRVMEEIRRRGLVTRIAVTTGASDPGLMNRVRELKPDVVLQKPMTAADIWTALTAQ